MKKYKLLVLTDHSGHTVQNSLYPLLLEMHRHKRCAVIDVASRGMPSNSLFFENRAVKRLFAVRVNPAFSFDEKGAFFRRKAERVSIREYDAVLLRLPHPVAPEFWSFLESSFPTTLFINKPSGMLVAGNKSYLMNFQAFCPPMTICHSLEEIEAFKSRFPIVLKPVTSYGGKGIVRIIGDEVRFSEGGKTSWEAFAQEFQRHPVEYLAVKYLEKVGKGDKRIAVCCGELLGAALRYPASGGWVCNVAQGGRSVIATPDPDEEAIIEAVDPHLRKMGVVFYGIDTLEGDNGKRILSEINALSIGGLHAMHDVQGVPAIRKASDLLWDFIHKEHN